MIFPQNIPEEPKTENSAQSERQNSAALIVATHGKARCIRSNTERTENRCGPGAFLNSDGCESVFS
jgi:hypothetical protein